MNNFLLLIIQSGLLFICPPYRFDSRRNIPFADLEKGKFNRCVNSGSIVIIFHVFTMVKILFFLNENVLNLIEIEKLNEKCDSYNFAWIQVDFRDHDCRVVYFAMSVTSKDLYGSTLENLSKQIHL